MTAVRVAAGADPHLGVDGRGLLRPLVEEAAARADLVLVAGDLTRVGAIAEAETVADELTGLPVPVLVVLGNHDHHSCEQDHVVQVLEEKGVRVLEGDGTVVDVGGTTVGVAGVKGFGGGFLGASGSEFGEAEFKDFMRATRESAEALEQALGSLHTDVRIAMTHYAPVAETLGREAPEIFPFLGSHRLADAIDAGGAHLAVHGHAHIGTEEGTTPGGVPVRNVALPVIDRRFRVYRLDETGVSIEAPPDQAVGASPSIGSVSSHASSTSSG
jgi:Icc-related predicted phosphoesterase